MPRVAIITDSTADLSPELCKQANVKVVPSVVQFDGEEFLDGVNLNTDRLFELVEKTRRLPKTASQGPGAFRDAFDAATADGSEAVFIGISTRLSATIQNARIAADMLPHRRIRVFDSANLSTGIGLQVMLASDLAAQGKTADEVVAALEQARSKVRTSFMIDTLDYLHMGGRCSGVQAMLGSLLKLRPIISVVDGGMVVAAKVRGPRQKCLDWMLEGFAQDAGQGLVRPERVFITHTGVPGDALFLAGEIRRIMPSVREVLETRAGAVIGSHCGPGTIGLLYMVK